MARRVVVSNRVVDLAKAAQAGGVAVLIADVLREQGGLWFGWNGRIAEDGEIAPVTLKIARSRPQSATATLPLSPIEHRDYYLGYANSVLWPVFHNRLDLARFDAGFYDRYLAVNQRFAAALFPLLEDDDVIWIHDYHLIPLAAELRKLGADNPIGFYLHIPVPPPQTFLAIPEHQQLASALTAYDLIGLQTTTDVSNLIKFLSESVAGRILQDGRIGIFDRQLAIQSFPVGINVDDFAGSAPGAPAGGDQVGTYRIIGVDRLDYTKGLPQKFTAFGRFLEKYPHYRGRVGLSQIAPPTRESVEAYSDIRTTLESLSGKINGMFGELDWMPIHYIHRSAPRKKLRDIYRSSRIGMFTPLRDGMNLVAKEYVAAQDPADPGVLILSRFAGAAEQMTDALVVNPYNTEEMAEAIRVAVEMPKPERIDRHGKLLATIKEHDTPAWSRSFLKALAAHGEERRRAATDLSVSMRRTLDSLGKMQGFRPRNSVVGL